MTDAVVSRVALGVSYDGSAFNGWQTQPHRRTVQDTLEAALARFVGQPVPTVCAGRTDTGVHAASQVVHLDSPVRRTEEAWVRGVNAHLPSTVSVRWSRFVADDFHARFSAHARSYVYALLVDRVRSPLWAGKAGWSFYPLDVAAMQQAAACLLGEHDFSSFRAAECQAKSPVRTLHGLDIAQRGRFVVFSFRANAFLHHMVRNLVGALVYVGQGRQTPDWMSTVLSARDRRVAAPTFAPDGLYLTGVDYPDTFGLPELDASDEIRFAL